MNTSFVRIASLHGKDLLAPPIKNATNFVVRVVNIKGIKELDSLGAVMAAYQPVRHYFESAGSAGVFEEWKYKNLSKTKKRLPMCLQLPHYKPAMEYAVKRHNLKMGTKLELLDIRMRGNIGVIYRGYKCYCQMFVKDEQGKCKRLAAVVSGKRYGKFDFATPLFTRSRIL